MCPALIYSYDEANITDHSEAMKALLSRVHKHVGKVQDHSKFLVSIMFRSTAVIKLIPFRIIHRTKIFVKMLDNFKGKPPSTDYKKPYGLVSSSIPIGVCLTFLNVQSIRNKIVHMKLFTQQYKSDILAIRRHWCSITVSTSWIQPGSPIESSRLMKYLQVKNFQCKLSSNAVVLRSCAVYISPSLWRVRTFPYEIYCIKKFLFVLI
ncbi:hypothetical protein HHI36_008792 [Cryptolaemus montrouzieri]|uniref:Uncharacterized protein n=1 Tax=Cryptolaemus montrouzieri TaxID=559131 RepID=A0ABD2MTS8_9CUCU